jgi:hypothetical protein
MVVSMPYDCVFLIKFLNRLPSPFLLNIPCLYSPILQLKLGKTI